MYYFSVTFLKWYILNAFVLQRLMRHAVTQMIYVTSRRPHQLGAFTSRSTMRLLPRNENSAAQDCDINYYTHFNHLCYSCFFKIMQRKLQYPAVFDRYDVCYDWRITGQPGEYLELFLIRTVQYDQPCTMGRSCFYVFDGNLWRLTYGYSSFQKILKLPQNSQK